MGRHRHINKDNGLVLGLRYRQCFVVRKMVSASVWLLLPPLTLVASRSTVWEPLFWPRPFNTSYDAMFMAATAGIALASQWVLYKTVPGARTISLGFRRAGIFD